MHEGPRGSISGFWELCRIQNSHGIVFSAPAVFCPAQLRCVGGGKGHKTSLLLLLISLCPKFDSRARTPIAQLALEKAFSAAFTRHIHQKQHTKNLPIFATLPMKPLFVALAVLALIRSCSACEIVDLPQSSYSFSGCYSGCATAGNTHVLIKLDSVQAWSAVVRLHINIFTNGMPFSCVANKYVLSVFTAVLQAADVNQWVKADLGAESLVCGVTTQGRGESIHIIGCNKPEHFVRFLAIALIAHHHPCFPVSLDYGDDTSLQMIWISGLLIMKS